MNQESMPHRMRAFRVIDFQEGVYYRCIVIEDVECAQFRVSSCSFGGGRTEAMQADIDRGDVLDVLQFLRHASRFPEPDQNEPTADSIDAAVSQDKMRLWEYMERFFPGKIPISVPSEPEPTGKESKPVVILVPSGSPSEKEVWDFAGGKRLEWKLIGSTPAGRKCEVLTFDGSEEVLVGATWLEIPAQ